MLKVSFYTYFYSHCEREYMYHLLSESFLEIDSELKECLINGTIENIPSDIKSLLAEKGFLVEQDRNEVESIRYADIVKRYQSKLMRLTILPTINCNFRCWYCYETHKYSRMSKEQANCIFEFLKKEITEKHLTSLVADWFGGEPLLCFDNIIYPFSKKVKKWCAENDVNFCQSITTNASLIDDKMVDRMNEIGLNQFQITLDGGKEDHNEVRKSKAMPNSYDVIVKNIHSLCRKITNVSMVVRINYTPDNIDRAMTILNAFDYDIRNKIQISPHIVWQKANENEMILDKVVALKEKAIAKGYIVNLDTSIRRCVTCYTDNMEQFVVNYDLHVYKCTARDFNDKFSIGIISEKGEFKPNNLFYKYYVTPSSFLSEKCLGCNLLPCCMNANTCLQKSIEGKVVRCSKEQIKRDLNKSLTNKILAYENTKSN